VAFPCLDAAAATYPHNPQPLLITTNNTYKNEDNSPPGVVVLMQSGDGTVRCDAHPGCRAYRIRPCKTQPTQPARTDLGENPSRSQPDRSARAEVVVGRPGVCDTPLHNRDYSNPPA